MCYTSPRRSLSLSDGATNLGSGVAGKDINTAHAVSSVLITLSLLFVQRGCVGHLLGKKTKGPGAIALNEFGEHHVNGTPTAQCWGVGRCIQSNATAALLDRT